MNSRGPSVYDVARAAGVSTASVSRYFRSPERLSEATRLKVERAVDELDYLPSGLASGLAEQRSGMIGLYSFSGHEPDELDRERTEPGAGVRSVSEDDEPVPLFPLFADEVLHGVELECTLRGYPLAVGWQEGADRGVGLDDIARRCDSLIVLPATVSASHLRRLARRMPVVFVAQSGPQGVDGVSVTVDNLGGAEALTAHLIRDHGHRRFWYVGAIDGEEQSRRFAGFASALRAQGLPVPTSTMLSTGSRAGAAAQFGPVMASVMAAGERVPNAIVCSSDQTALGVIEALSGIGLRCPEDVAVTGFDGIQAGRLSAPSLTTVRQPMADLGREAVSAAVALLEGERPPSSIELPVRLQLRRSCGCPQTR